MNKRLLVGVAISLFFSKCSDKKCESVKTGNFRSPRKNVLITRTDSTQVEIVEQDKRNLLFRVKWINDCDYYMILEKDNSINPITEYSIGDTFRINITKIQADRYDYSIIYKGKILEGFNYID